MYSTSSFLIEAFTAFFLQYPEAFAGQDLSQQQAFSAVHFLLPTGEACEVQGLPFHQICSSLNLDFFIAIFPRLVQDTHCRKTLL